MLPVPRHRGSFPCRHCFPAHLTGNNERSNVSLVFQVLSFLSTFFFPRLATHFCILHQVYVALRAGYWYRLGYEKRSSEVLHSHIFFFFFFFFYIVNILSVEMKLRWVQFSSNYNVLFSLIIATVSSPSAPKILAPSYLQYMPDTDCSLIFSCSNLRSSMENRRINFWTLPRFTFASSHKLHVTKYQSTEFKLACVCWRV